MKRVASFHGISVYETSRLGLGYDSAGLCLPGIGIFIGKGTYTEANDVDLLRHEFGHILQAREIGYLSFYLCVGLPSLLSAWTGGFGRGHQSFWVEGWCNTLAKDFFTREDSRIWPNHRFPPRPINSTKLRWISWGI